MSVLVGIAGGTGSGKTSLAVKIRDRVGADRCLLLAQDAYYKDGSNLNAVARAAINYDHPDAFDTTLLVQDLRDLKAGRPAPQLSYDHASYQRRVLPDPLPPRPVILLEGILILAEEPLRRLMDIKLFIDTDADVRILRRLQDARFVDFAALFSPEEGVPVLIVSLLAVLELAREGLVEVTQAEAYARIYVRLRAAQLAAVE